MEEKLQRFLGLGRKIIKNLVEHDQHPLKLDYSKDSLAIVQGFLSSMEVEKLDPNYVGNAFLAMAVYLGDIFLKEVGDLEWKPFWDESGALKELALVKGELQINLLSIARKAQIDPEGANIVKKFPFLLESAKRHAIVTSLKPGPDMISGRG